MVTTMAAPAIAQISSGPEDEESQAPRPAPIFDVNTIDPESYHVVAVRLPEGEAPVIDGKLDEPLWELADPVGNFIQREPNFGAPSTERTEFRILYDDQYIYFGVWCFDSDPSGIWASELKRDSGLQKGDVIKIALDAMFDRRTSYYFSTNPLGAYKDANGVEDGRTVNFDWNAVWENKTSIDDAGWYAEVAIPLSQLPLQDGSGTTPWSLNVCRIIIRKKEETYWVPFPREWATSGIWRMSRAGVILGIRDLERPRRMEFLPYIAPEISRDYRTDTSAETEVGYGFDLRIGLTQALKADVTYRTDFAQVEADQEIVNLSRFSLFFPEKRPFFTESAAIFDYGTANSRRLGRVANSGTGANLLPLFYSRRIGLYEGQEVPIIGGGKVSGRAGPYTLGLLNITTDSTTLNASDGRGEFVDRANYSVVRVKRDFLARSSVGFIVTNREGGAGDPFNRSLGLDASLSLFKDLSISALLAKTFSPVESGNGGAGALDIAWKNDRFNYQVSYLDIGERFDAQMGFIPRTDIRRSQGWAAWTPRPHWPGTRQISIGAGVEYYENHAGATVTRSQKLDFTIVGNDRSRINATLDSEYDLLPEDWNTAGSTIRQGGYSWDTFGLSYRSDRSRVLYGDVSVDWGGYYSGERQSFGAGLGWLPLDTLLIELDYTRNHITLPNAPLYVTNTVNSRISYSFTPDLFVKSFVQYNSARRQANFNFLFWYRYRPGSDLYVVYNEGWDTDLPGPRSIMTSDRQLAVKFTYWWSR